MSAFLRIGEDLLEDAERQLGLPGRPPCERSDVILHLSRADGIEGKRAENGEMRQDLADTRRRRASHALAVTLEPASESAKVSCGAWYSGPSVAFRWSSWTKRSASFLSRNDFDLGLPAASQRAR